MKIMRLRNLCKKKNKLLVRFVGGSSQGSKGLLKSFFTIAEKNFNHIHFFSMFSKLTKPSKALAKPRH
jgi:hypothetical protein